eukprot:scaffold22420_cov139-Skeletonema_dohrnii-CCMP3373.AAC.1
MHPIISAKEAHERIPLSTICYIPSLSTRCSYVMSRTPGNLCLVIVCASTERIPLTELTPQLSKQSRGTARHTPG